MALTFLALHNVHVLSVSQGGYREFLELLLHGHPNPDDAALPEDETGKQLGKPGLL